MNKPMLKLAAQLARGYEQDYAAYESAVASYLHDGLSPEHCEHGTRLWVSYDPICGACENGETMRDPMQRRLAALAEAKRRMRRVDAITEWVVRASVLGLARWVDMNEVTKEITREMTA